jgi:lysophospholipase L1-like esterase
VRTVALLVTGAVLWAQPDRAAPRTDANSMKAHQQLLEKAAKGGIDIYFEGDSITRRWGATDYPQLFANWKQNFFGWSAADFGWGADRVENILWRLENGELDGVHPQVIVLQAGTNNLADSTAEEISQGLRAVVRVLQAKAPRAAIIVTGIFPRNDNMALVPKIQQINADLSSFEGVRYLDINSKLADRQGKLFDGMMNADKLHPAVPGYQVWADALKPIFTELLGAPGATDHAPPPTGDPSKP